MKFKSNVVQDSILCIILYLVYVCLFFERSLFPSITTILTDIILLCFILASTCYCVYYSYKLKFQFLFINLIFYLPFYYIITFVKSSTKIGYSLYEFYRIVFHYPLQSYGNFHVEYWIVYLAIISIISGIVGIIIIKRKKNNISKFE